MIILTPALQEDVPRLFQLNRELINRYEDLSSIDYDRVLHWVQENIQRQLPYFSRILYDGKIAGYFCLTETEGSWELDSLFLLPSFQRKGIGTWVLRHCQEQCPSLFLYVFRDNTGAVRLYEKMGFSVTKEVGKTRYIMEWKNQD